jgi:hypothetical protein
MRLGFWLKRRSIDDVTGFRDVSPTTLADVLGREQVMDIGTRLSTAPSLARSSSSKQGT